MARINLALEPFAYYPHDKINKRPVLADVGSAVSIGSSIVGGFMGDKSAKSASNAQVAGGGASLQEINNQKTSNTAAFAPYSNTGRFANSELGYLLGLDFADAAPTRGQVQQDNYDMLYQKALNGGKKFGKKDQKRLEQYTNELFSQKMDEYNQKKAAYDAKKSDPSFGSLKKDFTYDDLSKDVVYQNGLQFGLDQGTNQINSRARASGSNDSGAVLKALLQYGNDYATTKTGDAQARFVNKKNNLYSILSGQQGVGLNATGNNQSLNTNLTGMSSGVQSDIGNSQAAGIVGSANARTGALSNLANQNWGNIFGSGGGNVSPGINLRNYGSGVIWN